MANAQNPSAFVVNGMYKYTFSIFISTLFKKKPIVQVSTVDVVLVTGSSIVIEWAEFQLEQEANCSYDRVVIIEKVDGNINYILIYLLFLIEWILNSAPLHSKTFANVVSLNLSVIISNG